MTDVLIEEERTQRYREEVLVTMETETEMMQLQAKECQGLPGANRS